MGYLWSACGFVFLIILILWKWKNPIQKVGWQLEERVGWRSASKSKSKRNRSRGDLSLPRRKGREKAVMRREEIILGGFREGGNPAIPAFAFFPFATVLLCSSCLSLDPYLGCGWCTTTESCLARSSENKLKDLFFNGVP